MTEATTRVAAPLLQDYAPIVGEAEIAELRALALRLKNRRVKMVNSTAVGGGVAEILSRLVPLMEECDIATRWEVITGGEKFFHFTKAFHNALHGAPYEGASDWFDEFLATNEEKPPAHAIRRRLRRHPRSAACGAGGRARFVAQSLGLEMPHRSFSAEPRSLAISAAVGRTLRRFVVFIAAIHARLAHTAVPIFADD